MRAGVRKMTGTVLFAAILATPATAMAQASVTPARAGGTDVGAIQEFGMPAFQQAYQYWKAGQYDQMLGLVLPLAERGDPLAQFLMGTFCSMGEGVSQDEERAVSWWRRAAEQGLARAQNEIGVALTDGRGVEPDPAEAVEWYRKAAAQGLAVAQANLGLMYWNGLGVQKDERQAITWYRAAADQGLGWAQFYLGNAYASGRGVSRSQSRAAEWFRKAAAQDYTDAQSALGEMYLRGAGMRQDYSRAAYWLALAARSGHERAGALLKSATVQLPRTRLPGGTEIRQAPAASSAVIRMAKEREVAYRLARIDGWTEVYFEDGHAVGYISSPQ